VPNSALQNSAITVIGTGTVTVTGSPVSLGGTITIGSTGVVTEQLTGNTGVATSLSNNINVVGDSSGIQTAGASHTLTLSLANIPNSSLANSAITVDAGSNITVTGSPVSLGGTITIAASGATSVYDADVGSASPSASVLNVNGYTNGVQQLMETYGSGNTLKIENRTWWTPLVVDPSSTAGSQGTYTTIGAALSAATSGQNIYIRPGTYTENPTLVAGVNLIAHSPDPNNATVIIQGTCSASFTGSCCLEGITLETNSNYALSLTGSNNTKVTCKNCNILATNNVAINQASTNGSSSLWLFDCYGDIQSSSYSLFQMSGAGYFSIYWCYLANSSNSNNPNICQGTGQLDMHYSRCMSQIETTGSSAFDLLIRHCQFPFNRNLTAIVHGQTATGFNYVQWSTFATGNQTCITVASGTEISLHFNNFETTATNALSGAGTVYLCNNTYNYGSSALSGLTNPLYEFSEGTSEQWLSESGSTFTAISNVNYALESGSNTVTLPSSPNNGDIISFVVGVSAVGGTQKIYTPSGFINTATGSSSSGGYIQSNVIYSTLKLVYINGLDWVATELNGTWTLH